MTGGLTQGGSLSPVLFLNSINEKLKVCKTKLKKKIFVGTKWEQYL